MLNTDHKCYDNNRVSLQRKVSTITILARITKTNIQSNVHLIISFIIITTIIIISSIMAITIVITIVVVWPYHTPTQ